MPTPLQMKIKLCDIIYIRWIPRIRPVFWYSYRPFSQKRRSMVDWGRWRHKALLRGTPLGPASARAGPGWPCREWKCGVLWCCLSTPHSIPDPSTAPHVCCCCRMNWWDVVRWVQMCVSIWGAVRLHSMDGWALSGADVRAPWNGVLKTVAPLRRSSAGWMLARVGRLSAGVARRRPVTIRKASLMAESMRQVWALRHQASAQYPAVKCTTCRAGVAFRRVVSPSP